MGKLLCCQMGCWGRPLGCYDPACLWDVLCRDHSTGVYTSETEQALKPELSAQDDFGGISSRGFIFSWQSSKAKASSKYSRGLFYLFIVIFLATSVSFIFSPAIIGTVFMLWSEGFDIFGHSVAYQKHEIAVLKQH